MNHGRKDTGINVEKRNSQVKFGSSGFSGNSNSYAFAVKQGTLDKKVEETKPVSVLYESCVLQQNLELHKKRNLEVATDDEEIPEIVFDQEHPDFSKKEPHSNVQEDAYSDDPFNLYDLLKKKRDDGGSILNLMDEVVKVGQTIGYKMEGCIKNIEEIIESRGVDEVNFLSLQETKIMNVEIFSIKMCWGNYAFDFVHSPSVGKSGGILCVWDPRLFRKTNSTISDYFVILRELSEKKRLWNYLNIVIANWKGEVIIMGDFNEVCTQAERYGSVFNVQGADAFNLFISSAGLVEVPLDGCSYTWCHKSVSKMSKIDRFLISEGLMGSCPNISAITLDRYLFDHRPILLREASFDYGHIPFRFFHFWFELEGFDNFVESIWKELIISEPNAMLRSLKSKLADIEGVIDKGDANPDVLNQRMYVVKSLQDLDKLESLEVAQKAKIKWSIKGDENSKYYHGILNKKRSQLVIRGILVDDQQADMEKDVSKEEIKRAVWDCGLDKSPGPDGFTFGFYRRYWGFLESDVVEAVTYFFQYGSFPKGSNSSFIALIPKMHDAKLVKDFRPISLIGSLYKIIAKILANRMWCKNKKKQSMIFKVDFEKAYDSVRWDYLDDIWKKFGFGDRCFIKGLKQGDLHSPFLFILVMESLYILFQRVVDAGLFKGVCIGLSLQLSHLFYADDVVFMGQWSDSNIGTIVQVLECFYRASGLRINMNKSKLMGIGVKMDKVVQAAQKIRLEHNVKKPMWVKWNKVLASKEKGGLGVSSFYALNRALMFKWMWRFRNQSSSLWARVIKAIHGEDVGNGADTLFWEDIWRGDVAFNTLYPRVYSLEKVKNIYVASKLSHEDMGYSLRRPPKGGAEQV
ncbi:RNA-directed DNA polymerase, eukaryota, reverse transcriptase zinc-binding domain protein [Tanacetum coccineum]